MIGRLISGRYRIEAVVGTGGMAVVYRAHDIREDRRVAIKVLRPEYQSDDEFVRRFGREAEAAAKMAHDNIVNMLDVGIDGDMRYIVMEYVDGQTLKDMIRQEGRIHPDVALRMTIRILAAVDHAHRNGIVHRDIKPQNILVDKEGHVKVADFGIARLKTAQTTQLDANGSAMGSVHYLSPEQARGEVADEQSDLYSVGVVLYEMLTGHVPFDGDTTISVALKHVNEQPKSMRLRNPQISRALDEVVMRALCKDKRRRYQTAAEMAADLRRTITQPKGGFVTYPVLEEDTQRTEDAQKKKAQSQHQKLQRVVMIAIVVAVFVMLLSGVFYFLRMRGQLKMPQLLGLPQAEAVETLSNMQVEAAVVNAYSDDYPVGTVMLQSRDAGARIRENTVITLTVSLGTQWYYLEDMTGWNLDRALKELETAEVSSITLVYAQDDAPVGTVLGTDLTSGWQTKDTPLVLRVSGQSVSMPSLSGLTLDGARAVIEAEGLVLGQVSEGDSADARSGTVITQSIAPYTQVLTGTSIDLTICRQQNTGYTPDTALTVVVPLEGLLVEIDLALPSGETVTALSQEMSAGTHVVELTSTEPGVHTVYIYTDNVLMEELELDFE